MANQKEDYLDQLLYSLNKKEVPEEKNEEQSQQIEETSEEELVVEEEQADVDDVPSVHEEVSDAVSFESSFLEEYDEDLEGYETDGLMSAFEAVLKKDELSSSTKNSSIESMIGDETFTMEDIIEEYSNRPVNENKVMEEEDPMFMDVPEKIEADREEEEYQDEVFIGGDELQEEEAITELMMEQEGSDEQPLTEQSFEEEAPGEEASEESAFEDIFGEGLFSDDTNDAEKTEDVDEESDDDLLAKMMKDITGFDINEFSDGVQADEPVAMEDVEDIMSILDGMSDDEELADIGKMLKAQDENIDISADEPDVISADEALRYLDDRDVKQPKAKETLKDDKEKKSGFGKKLSLLFFGPEEDELTVHVHPNNGIEDTTAENEQILKELEAKNAKKAEKQKKKEEKLAEKNRKKEEKKKLKAEAKAAKPKKEKKPKEVDNSPPLPKVPVALIWVLAISLVIAVLFASNGFHYMVTMRNVNESYSNGEYVEAYKQIKKLKLKEKDYSTARRVAILASVAELIDAYDVLYDVESYENAVDCLIRAVGRYEDNLEEATELGIEGSLERLKDEALHILEDTYQLSYDEVMDLYETRNRKKYSLKIVKQLKEIGLIR